MTYLFYLKILYYIYWNNSKKVLIPENHMPARRVRRDVNAENNQI